MAASLTRTLPLNALRALEATARLGSFTRAAAELGVTQGAVSRHVNLLEARLGFELFVRTPQGLQPAPGSRALAGVLGDAFGRIAQALDSLAATHAHKVLVVRGYTTFLTRWLIPRLPAFQLAHPDVEVRLVSGSDAVDFERDAVDVGVRYGRGRWRHCRSDLLFLDELSPVCHPDHPAAHAGRPADAIASATLLHHNLRPSDWPDWLAASGLERSGCASDLHFEDLGIIYECARARLGLAMGQRAYLGEDVASGRLVEPFDAVLRRDLGYYLVCPQDRMDAPKIRAFRDWLLRERPAPA